MTSPQTYPHPGAPEGRRVRVVLDRPGLGPLDYLDLADKASVQGDWVLVPLAQRSAIGVVLEAGVGPDGHSGPLREIRARLDQLPRLMPEHIRFAEFVGRYYRRGIGSVLLTGLPSWLKQPGHHESKSGRPPLVDRMRRALTGHTGPCTATMGQPGPAPAPTLTEEQALALQAIREELALEQPRPVLIHGLTGTGKTRLYQSVMAELLATKPCGQILVMVPEIGLTPQLQTRMQAAFPGERIAVMHSGLTERARAEQWMLASTGQARIVLGTRLAVLCPLPDLRAIVVDEEHDASFKQQEGVRYHARDLAVWLGQDRRIPVLLASATPSLESWVQAARGRYRKVCMGGMASGADRPAVRLIDLVQQAPSKDTGLSPTAEREISAALSRGDQVLLFVNRRGWAPVMVCDACGWRAHCRDCDVATVLHRQRGRWRSICHHCGLSVAPPKSCPDCGQQDLSTLGQGTQRLEVALQTVFPQAVVARMDRDEIKTPQDLEALLQRVSAQEVAILVGTQMAAKGHDFERLRLVVVLDADAQLTNPDFRGPEWLYAGIAQVAGRAGRHPGANRSAAAQVLIQTRYPQHPVFSALTDPQPLRGMDQLWTQIAADRQEAGLPPFGSMALISASHRSAEVLIPALQDLSDQLAARGGPWGARASAPVPRYPERVGGRARWQLVLEAPTRKALQALLDEADPWVQANRAKLHTQIEVDPLGLG